MPNIVTKKGLVKFLSDNYFTDDTVPLNYSETKIVVNQIMQFLEDVAYNDWELSVKNVVSLNRSDHEGKMMAVPKRGEKSSEKVWVEPYSDLRFTFPPRINKIATQGLRDRKKENKE